MRFLPPHGFCSMENAALKSYSWQHCSEFCPQHLFELQGNLLYDWPDWKQFDYLQYLEINVIRWSVT